MLSQIAFYVRVREEAVVDPEDPSGFRDARDADLGTEGIVNPSDLVGPPELVSERRHGSQRSRLESEVRSFDTAPCPHADVLITRRDIELRAEVEPLPMLDAVEPRESVWPAGQVRALLGEEECSVVPRPIEDRGVLALLHPGVQSSVDRVDSEDQPALAVARDRCGSAPLVRELLLENGRVERRKNSLIGQELSRRHPVVPGRDNLRTLFPKFLRVEQELAERPDRGSDELRGQGRYDLALVQEADRDPLAAGEVPTYRPPLPVVAGRAGKDDDDGAIRVGTNLERLTLEAIDEGRTTHCRLPEEATAAVGIRHDEVASPHVPGLRSSIGYPLHREGGVVRLAGPIHRIVDRRGGDSRAPVVVSGLRALHREGENHECHREGGQHLGKKRTHESSLLWGFVCFLALPAGSH